MTSKKRQRNGSPTLAYFISPHGFGHAARASAVMNAIQERAPGTRFEIYTRVPEWFFQESLKGSFSYHELLTDVGLVQEGPLRSNLTETVECLDQFMPFAPELLETLAGRMNRSKCRMVLCDISPLGIAAAREAGGPWVLVENISWDWVYREYAHETAGLTPHMKALERLFSRADVHIQTTPVCFRKRVHLTTEPVSRRPRSDRHAVRKALGISERTKVVLITMGGIPKDHGFIARLSREKGVYFVVPGAGKGFGTFGNVRLLPHHSRFYHPDLVHAADAVVGKVGYSTLAEVHHAGIPFGYVKRARFRESEVLSEFIETHMRGFAVGEEAFETGEWIFRVPELLALSSVQPGIPNGDEAVADFVLRRLKGF